MAFLDYAGLSRFKSNLDTLFSGKKNTQSAVSDPTASGTATKFISGITQNAQGVISPSKASLPTASTSGAGIVQLNDTLSSSSTTQALTAKQGASLNQAIENVQDGLAIVANGNTHAAIAAGQFVYVKNHSSLSEGVYTANDAIAANATLSSSNLTADPQGGLNSLYGSINTLNSNIGKLVANGSITQEHIYCLHCEELTISNAVFDILYNPNDNQGIQNFSVCLTNGTNIYCCVAKISLSNGQLSITNAYRRETGASGVDAWNVSIRNIRMIA